MKPATRMAKLQESWTRALAFTRRPHRKAACSLPTPAACTGGLQSKMVFVILVGLSLSLCRQEAGSPSKEAPSAVSQWLSACKMPNQFVIVTSCATVGTILIPAGVFSFSDNHHIGTVLLCLGLILETVSVASCLRGCAPRRRKPKIKTVSRDIV